MESATLERLKIGQFTFRQPHQGYRFSVDAVLLADFITLKPAARLIDLGTGAGILPLLLAALTPVREIVGLEIQARLAAFARENVACNQLEQRIQIVEGDLRQAAQLFRAGEFDALCSNPPYRKVGAGRLNPDAEQAMARHEIACQLRDLFAAAKYLVRPGGKVFLTYLPERLGELCGSMRAERLEPKKLRCVHATAQTAASLILIEAQRDAAPGLKILPPLFLYNPAGEYTDEAKRILREA